jgi:hypothetical protein
MKLSSPGFFFFFFFFDANVVRRRDTNRHGKERKKRGKKNQQGNDSSPLPHPVGKKLPRGLHVVQISVEISKQDLDPAARPEEIGNLGHGDEIGDVGTTGGRSAPVKNGITLLQKILEAITLQWFKINCYYHYYLRPFVRFDQGKIGVFFFFFWEKVRIGGGQPGREKRCSSFE